ncbi:MAG: DUF3048 domain-containing protein [Clostridiales bacterium]|nr:MAG: DUF3048 domain-containing protein [Clostridiales bacterium]
MIDNDNSSAWPQSGLDKAYKVYEVIVEGGATRFMALFKKIQTAKNRARALVASLFSRLRSRK